jgi:hypothetical protein
VLAETAALDDGDRYGAAIGGATVERPDAASGDRPDSWPFVAYRTLGEATPDLVPVPSWKTRDWIDDTPGRFARRCLPLLVAGQAGWVLTSPIEFRVRWDGSVDKGGIEIRPGDPDHPAATCASDHFGSGIVTFSIPYLFRTPPGIALLVRGAPNFWVDGAHPLEGLVETDWSPMTFTMNWRLLTPHTWVRFAAGDPICFLQPISVDLIETAAPVVEDLSVAPDLDAAHRSWSQGRATFNADPARRPEQWERHYYLGRTVDGPPTDRHRTRVRVAPFAGVPTPPRPARRATRSRPGPTSVFSKAEGLTIAERGDNFVVTDGRGRAHQLNPSAVFILECCDGTTGPARITDIVQEAFELPEPPADLVHDCLTDLAQAGLVSILNMV